MPPGPPINAQGGVGGTYGPTAEPWAPIPQWAIDALNQMAASQQLDGVDPHILAAIMGAEGGNTSGAINGPGYGGYFGLSVTQAGRGLLSSTGLTPFEQQAALAATDFAGALQAAGGDVLKAEAYYQTGSVNGQSSGPGIFQSYGIGGTATAGGGPTDVGGSVSGQPGSTTIGGAQAQQDAAAVLQSLLAGLPQSLVNQLLPIATGIIQSTQDQSAALGAILESPAYQQYFAGNQQLGAKGLPPMNPADYLAYEQTAYALANAAGLPTGTDANGKVTIAGESIDNIVGSGMSISELEARIVNGYQAALSSDQQTRSYLMDNFGVTDGNLAAYFLNPSISVQALQQNLTASQIAGAGENAGFAPISVSRATQLAQLGVNQAAAVSGFKQIAPEVTLTKSGPGQGAGPTGTITQDQLVASQFVGDAASQRAVQQAQESRKSPFESGGGFAPAKAGTGVGFGSEIGVQGA